jgi:hypothetical protein
MKETRDALSQQQFNGSHAAVNNPSDLGMGHERAKQQRAAAASKLIPALAQQKAWKNPGKTSY